MSRLAAIAPLGQSIWLDYIRRDLIPSGALAKLIAEDAITGLTSNPAIFEKAIAGSALYDEALAAAVRGGEHDTARLTELLAIDDIRAAADLFAPLHAASGLRDGFVSLEVAPDLAHNTAATVAEARRLWAEVARPNLMIKVPGTVAGAAAIRTLIAEGINVNVTLLFSRAAYAAVAEAYVEGLEMFAARGGKLAGVASVASFFVSRIDAAIEPELKLRGDAAQRLNARVAIANAKLAYQDFLALSNSPRWQALATKGAQPQRLLWASTGTKSPALRDTLYVEALIGPATVNTVPPATLDAFRDHGIAARTLDADVAEAQAVLAEVAALRISLEAITAKLVVDGVQLFADAHQKLLAAVAAKRDAIAATTV